MPLELLHLGRHLPYSQTLENGKNISVTNALAYFAGASVTNKKSFARLAKG